MRACLPIILLLIVSCSEIKEPVSSIPVKDTIDSIIVPKIYFSGKPDLPEHHLEITEAGIGSILLGSIMDSIKINYPHAKEYSINENGISWPALRIPEENNKWLIIQSINTVNVINKIRTNNPLYVTKEGIHTGMKIDSILSFGKSLTADEEHKAFLLDGSHIFFKVDPVRERTFFGKGKMNFTILKGAIIEEIFIICGDC